MLKKLLKQLFVLSLLLLFFSKLLSQNNLPYPIIFLHGLTGSDESFANSFNYYQTNYNLGAVNVFDIVLNADNDVDKSLLADDVRWQDFNYTWWGVTYTANVGRRNFDSDKNNFVDGWTGTNLFAINFMEERIRGAWGTTDDAFDGGNESAIVKQGYALKFFIQEVLNYTGAEKVILVGHSMGGLCAREYLQRRDENGNPTNWVDPNSADGHKVARLVTIGTPHLGSNSGLDPTKKKKKGRTNTIPTTSGEALRDLKYSYDSYTNCGGSPVGIYLFGGNENCIKSKWNNATFANVNINCEGDENDNITGINTGTTFNPLLALPTNIRYTWITSNDLRGESAAALIGFPNGVPGDGSVLLERQWLYSGNNACPLPVNGETVADTLLIAKKHTDEGSAYYEVLRGLDEPDKATFAYNLTLNRAIIGFINHKSGWTENDADMFKVNCSGHSTIAITIDGTNSAVSKISFCDASGTELSSRTVSSFPKKLYYNVGTANTIYVKVNGTATATSWQNPYTLTAKSGSWTGTSSTDWNTANNWLVGIPDEIDDVSVSQSSSNKPIVTLDVECNKLLVNSNANLTVSSTSSITIHSNLTVNGSLILDSDQNGTASILLNNNVTGNITVKRYMKGNAYHFISSSINNTSSSAFRLLTDGRENPNLYYYDETINDTDWLKGWIKESGILSQAKGYAYHNPYTEKFTISGTPNNNNSYSIAVSNSSNSISSDGKNLIGNPYPSSILATSFINANNSGTISGAIYLWDDKYTGTFESADYGTFNTSGYVAGNLNSIKTFNGYISQGQAFFVIANSDGSVVFNKSMRTKETANFFKNKEINNLKKLKISLQGNNVYNETLIAFRKEASDEFDNAYDAIKMTRSTNVSLYSIVENKKLAIQSLSDFDNNMIISLGYNILESGNYYFKILNKENFSETTSVYIEDLLTNNVDKLSKNSIYEFYSKSGIYDNRFKIHFINDKTINDAKYMTNSKNIYSYGSNLFIKSNDGNLIQGKLLIYNIIGNLLDEHKINNSKKLIDLSKFNTKFFIVKLIENNNVISKKVIIN